MTNQQLSRASPNEEYAFVRKILDDAIDCYMPIGGASLARKHVEVLGDELQKLYPECTAVYYDVLARVCQAEKEEQQRAEAQRLELQQQMMMKAVMSAIHPQQQATPKPPPHTPQECPVLPAQLSTLRAMRLWQRLQQAGLTDAQYQPVGLSRTEMAILAFDMSKLLHIKDMWVTFGRLWRKKNLRNDYNDALNQRKSLEFRDEVKKLFVDIQKDT